VLATAVFLLRASENKEKMNEMSVRVVLAAVVRRQATYIEKAQKAEWYGLNIHK